MRPRFLRLDEVLYIHRYQVLRHGGTLEIRDMEGLISALAVPSATFRGRSLHRDVYEMAGAYLFHMVENRPFASGNLAAALATTLVFLLINEIHLGSTPAALEGLIRAAAAGRAPKARIADFLRREARIREGGRK